MVLVYFDFIDCLFIESSAMTGENIEEIFNKMTQTLIYKIDSGEIPEELVVTNKSVKQIHSIDPDENRGGNTQSG